MFSQCHNALLYCNLEHVYSVPLLEIAAELYHIHDDALELSVRDACIGVKPTWYWKLNTQLRLRRCQAYTNGAQWKAVLEVILMLLGTGGDRIYNHNKLESQGMEIHQVNEKKLSEIKKERK